MSTIPAPAVLTPAAPDDALTPAPAASVSPATLAFRAAALLAIIAASLALVSLQFWTYLDDYMTDDAFITFRYASNFANGLGPVWQPGDRVEGYTNFGWMALLALAQKLGSDPRTASRALGVIASTGALAVIPLLCAQVRAAWTPRWWILVAGGSLATALNTGFVLWTFAGLEVPAVCFLVTAGAAMFLFEERTHRAPIASPLLLAAAALMRPDSIVIWCTLALFKAATLVSGDWRARLPHVLLFGALFLVPFCAFWAWRWSFYGHFFPNTYYLKSDRNSDYYERGAEYAGNFLRLYWVWLGAAVVVPIWRELRAAYRPVLTLAGVMAVWTVYVVTTGGDWMPYFRFFAAMLPITYVLLIEGGISVVDLVPVRGAMRAVSMAAIVAIAAVVVVSAYRPHDDRTARQTENFSISDGTLPGHLDEADQTEIGRWLHDNVPHDYTMAQIATGIIPYHSQLRVIDMLGVNDEHIAKLPVPLGGSVSGHEKQDAGYVISRKPEIIWMFLLSDIIPRTKPEDYMPPVSTEKAPVFTDVINNSYIWFLYRPVAIRLQHGWFNILLRYGTVLPLPEGSIDPAPEGVPVPPPS